MWKRIMTAIEWRQDARPGAGGSRQIGMAPVSCQEAAQPIYSARHDLKPLPRAANLCTDPSRRKS